jgi:hypothetical protein
MLPKGYLLIAWFYGTLWSIFPLFSPHQYVMGSFQISCSIDFLDQSDYTRNLIILSNIFGFFIPIIIIIVCYGLIFWFLKKNSNSLNLKIRKHKGLSDTGSLFKNNSSENSSLKVTKSKLIPKSMSYNEGINSNKKNEVHNRQMSIDNQSIHYRKSTKNSFQFFQKPLFRKKNVTDEWQIAKTTIIIIVGFCLAW